MSDTSDTPMVEYFWTHDTSENGRKNFARDLERRLAVAVGALDSIFTFCNGYGLEAGMAAKKAIEALQCIEEMKP